MTPASRQAHAPRVRRVTFADDYTCGSSQSHTQQNANTSYPSPVHRPRSNRQFTSDDIGHRLIDAENISRRGLDPFSTVPFSPSQPHPDNGRTSQETLAESPYGKYKYDAPTVPPKSLNKYPPRSQYARRHSSAYARPDYDIEAIGHRPAGFFGRAKNAVKDFVTEQNRQSLAPQTRRHSWAGSMGSLREPQNNFEISLAINAETDETYLYDEGEHQHPGSSLAIERRESYAERRRSKKHTIVYCAEPLEEYQKFTLTFAKALLAFGSPSHRIEAQLNSLARVFNMEAQFQHVASVVQVSFGNPETKSSETCLIKSPINISLSRIHAVHTIYRTVLHDDLPASEGTRALQRLLKSSPCYSTKAHCVLSFICCLLISGVAFGGSLNDMWVAGLMGLIVRVLLTYAAKSAVSASGSEIFIAAIVAFVARGFSSIYSKIWCFTAISSAGIISMLPGFLMLSGFLDIAGRNISLGSPKIVAGLMTSLYLGFGLTLGSDVFLFIDRAARNALAAAARIIPPSITIDGTFQASNGTTSALQFIGAFDFANVTTTAVPVSHIVQGCYRDPSWAWYLQPLPSWSLFIAVPLFAISVSMNNQQRWCSRQMVVMVVIACVSFWLTRLCNLHWGLQNNPDYVALIGSFAIGILGNIYSRRFGGTAFTIMLTGVLLLIPDGLSAAGGLSENYNAPGQDEYTQSLVLARKMISVIIGIMAGVYSSAGLVYLFGKKKNAALVTF